MGLACGTRLGATVLKADVCCDICCVWAPGTCVRKWRLSGDRRKTKCSSNKTQRAKVKLGMRLQ
eukprot:6053144-Prymnesium_polylepis.1